MPWYYVTVEERHVWNVAVEAEDKKSARLKALDEVRDVEPDYIDKTEMHVEEAKGYVE